jgi:diguanylate cyclase (GGDEF)-like protein/PAS domain S-box-containing protein
MSKPLQVLIVDDRDEDAEQMVAELRRSGFSPSYARVAEEEELRSALSRQPWDLVVADHTLARMSALRVLDVLRQLQIDLPVIVVSGPVAEEELVAAMREGAQDCLSKRSLGRLGAVVERELRAAGVLKAGREAERLRQETEGLYRQLIEEIPALTYISWADETASPVYVSPQIKAMAGCTPAEWLADPGSWTGRIHADDRPRVLAEYRAAWATQKPFVSDYRMLHRDGRIVWWHDEGRPFRDAEGKARFVRGFVADITEQRRSAEELRYLTHHDRLTGLPNRTLLQERLEKDLTAARAEGRPVALLLMNLDRYREIRNTLGDDAADIIVRELARRVGDVLGEADRVARLKGDEFAAILPGADARLAQQVASAILKSLESPVVVEKLPIELAINIGIGVGPGHGDTAELLLRRADTALDAARRNGSGCVVYAPERDPYDPGALVLLGELRRAIEAEELTLHYQPKVDLKSRTITGAEALVRWRHSKRGMLPPDRFIPLAEQGGLIKALTRWVLGDAVEQGRAWQRLGHDLPISVNLSARNLQDPRLVEDITGLLATHSLPPHLLRLELTESSVMADPAHAVKVLGILRDAGVAVAIDDFGTGYSSLAYLRRLPVSELKIDKSFVIGMAGREQEDAAIVRSTSDLGHILGLSVVAEGVEDERTLELLGDIGCDAAQGYYIARPMPVAALEQWLTDSTWRARPS